MADGPSFAPLDPRNGYVPPRYLLHRLTEDSPRGWSRVPPVMFLTDLMGEEVPEAAPSIRLAWNATGLYLHAASPAPPCRTVAEWTPEHPKFWMQDHVDLRVGRPGQSDWQCIVSAGGRVWDSLGLWKKCASLSASAEAAAHGWTVRAYVAWPDLGLAPWSPGTVGRGQVAHMRWPVPGHEILALAATELGFGQTERMAELVCVEPQAAWIERLRMLKPQAIRPWVLPVGSARYEAELNGEAAVLRGAALLLRTGAATSEHRVEDRGGRFLAEFDGMLRRPVYSEWSFALRDSAGREYELGSCVLRAGVPSVNAAELKPHPRLLYDADALKRFPLAREHPFSAEFQDASRELLAHGAPAVPNTGARDPATFDLKPEDGNWFRICKESLLGAGASGSRPAPARIWGLLGAPAQAAAAGVVQAVKPTPEQLTPLLSAFNALLRRGDLFDREAFADARLPAAADELLRQAGRHPLEPFELARLNRMLLKSVIECLHVFGADAAGMPARHFELWLHDRDPARLERATAWARHAAEVYLPEPHTHLHEGMQAGHLALAYDAWRGMLSEEQRAVWRRLADIFLHQFIETSRARAWTVTCVPNANPVGNGGCGLLALALLGEHDLAEEALYRARRHIRIFLDYCSGPDGGNTEGVQYWQYGTENALRFALGLEKALGSADGFFEHPAFTKAMNNIRVSLCNDGCLHGMNDTIPMPLGMALAWFSARRYGDRFGAWYGDHAMRTYRRLQQAGRATPYRPAAAWEWLLRPDGPEVTDADQPPLPVCLVLKDIQYGLVRSSPNWQAEFTAGLKGARPPFTHHHQHDAGAIAVEYQGERLLIDPGYYKPQPSDHSLPLIDGRGPGANGEYAAEIYHAAEGSDWRYLAVDATRAYGSAARRVRRHLVLFCGWGVAIVDDLAGALGAPGRVCAQVQAGGATEALGPSAFSIRGAQAALRVDLLGPSGVLRLLPERSLHDTHWGYHFAACRLFPVHFDYAASAGPLLTLLRDGSASEPPAIRIEGGVLRVTQAGRAREVRLAGL